MWLNILIFVAASVSALYFYLTRNFGWFEARGIKEHDPTFPFGSLETKEMFQGRRNFARMLTSIYSR